MYELLITKLLSLSFRHFSERRDKQVNLQSLKTVFGRVHVEGKFWSIGNGAIRTAFEHLGKVNATRGF